MDMLQFPIPLPEEKQKNTHYYICTHFINVKRQSASFYTRHAYPSLLGTRNLEGSVVVLIMQEGCFNQ